MSVPAASSGSGVSSPPSTRSPPMPAVRLRIDVHVRRADALDDLAVEPRVARAAAGLGVAHVDVRDRGTGPGRLDRGLGDRGRRDGHALRLPRGVAGARHRAGDEDLPVHCSPLRRRCCAREATRLPDAASSRARERLESPAPRRPLRARHGLRQRGRHRLRLRAAAGPARRAGHDHLDDRPHRGARGRAARAAAPRCTRTSPTSPTPAQARALVAAAEAAHGPLDVLVNNAGLAQTGVEVEDAPFCRAAASERSGTTSSSTS